MPETRSRPFTSISRSSPTGYADADLDLDLLRRRLADEQVVVLAHELHDRHVELVAAGADRRVADDAGQRDDGDLRRAAADVDHHVARRRLDRKPDADRRRHRLGDHEHFLRAGAERRVAHRALLHFGDAATARTRSRAASP